MQELLNPAPFTISASFEPHNNNSLKMLSYLSLIWACHHSNNYFTAAPQEFSTSQKCNNKTGLTKAPFISLNTTPLKVNGVRESVGLSCSSLQPSCLKRFQTYKTRVKNSSGWYITVLSISWITKSYQKSRSLKEGKNTASR